jgi:tripartite ATP-independent transporter DctM subunit
LVLSLLVVAMLLLILMRVPIAFGMLIPCLGYVIYSQDISMGVALQRMTAGVNSFPLLAVPLFIMTGYLSDRAGMADRLFRMLMALLGGIPGSLAYVNVISSVLFSWMSGAAVADAAGLGSVLVPAMKKRGYDEGFALGLTGASSLIGPMMPPSIPAIIYAVTAGVSVGALFMAGILPALLLALVLCVVAFVHVRRNMPKDELPTEETSLSRAVLEAVPVLLTPVIILGGILGGIFTPTEAAAVAVMYVLCLGVWLRTLSWAAFMEVLGQTARTTGTIMLIVSAASLFGWVIAREQGPQLVADALTRMTDNPLLFLLLLNLILLVIGTLLEPVAALLIVVPILLPVAAQYGIHPLHLGVVMILNLVLGLLTPPVGLVLYVLSSVTGVPPARVIRGTMPFYLPLVLVLLLVTYLPAISLWLPSSLAK